MSRRDRWRAMSPDEQRLTVVALGWVVVAVLLLRIRPGAEPLPRGTYRRHADPPSVDRAVRRAARVVPAARCLAQSLAAQAMLPPGASIRYSVMRDSGSGRLEAHAWVEVAGQRVAGDPPPSGAIVLDRVR